MKKRNIPLLAGILSLFVLFNFLLFSCSPPGATNPSGLSKGSLSIAINESVSKNEAPPVGGPEENILPPISMDPVSYAITGSGPDGASFEQTTGRESLTVTDLAFGEWTVTVTALNADGTAIGSGTSATTVQSNATALMSITVNPYDGFGTLDLSLTWTESVVNTAQVESTLTPASGTARTLDFIVGSSSATFSADDVGTGYHTLVLKLLDNGILTMGAVDVVRIVADNTTTGSFTFDQINQATGSIDVGITPEMGDPLTVEIAGESETKAANETMSLTASVTNYSGNISYIWYVNGDAANTGETFDFNSSWPQGYYRIDVTAYNTDGSRAGSESVFVEVGETDTSDNIVQISGAHNTFMVKADGSLWGTGRNDYGQLGIGTNLNVNTFTEIMNSDVMFVSGRYFHTMIIKTDGSLWATGKNEFGQFGNGTVVDSNVPIQILSSGVKSVSTGYDHTIILKTDGSLWAAGKNTASQLGDGTTTNSSVFVEVISSGVKTISQGGSGHTMIIKTDGSLWGMGYNGSGQLGNGSIRNPLFPVEIMASDVKAVSCGFWHTLILKTDGSLWATGENDDGELGDGTTTYKKNPVQILSGGVQDISASDGSSFVLKTDGSLWATGGNENGEFGTGVNTAPNILIEIVSSGVESVFSGRAHTIIQKSDGSWWVTGSNSYGQYGDGTNLVSWEFVEMIF